MTDTEYMKWLKKIDKARSDENPSGTFVIQLLLSVLMYLEAEDKCLTRELIQEKIDELRKQP